MGEPRLSAERPDEKRERRALSWLMDVQKNHDNRLYREFATTVIESLAWFEGREQVERERAERLERALSLIAPLAHNLSENAWKPEGTALVGKQIWSHCVRALSAASTPKGTDESEEIRLYALDVEARLGRAAEAITDYVLAVQENRDTDSYFDRLAVLVEQEKEQGDA